MRYKLSYFFILLLSTSTLSGCLSLKEKAAIKAEQDKIEQQRQLEELQKTFKS
ncbi:hypothetical protein JEP40_18960, partial [Proteus vulgaris]|nr:hypothetical protein [Proteus vulgaris]